MMNLGLKDLKHRALRGEGEEKQEAPELYHLSDFGPNAVDSDSEFRLFNRKTKTNGTV